MKNLLATCLLALSLLTVTGQPYGNEWIDYQQKYIRIAIPENGIYQLRQPTLVQVLDEIGEDLSDIDPRSIQIFGRGAEQPIYISGEADGVFNTQDYIEFYAEMNDGWFDSLLYETPEQQNNPHYSLFTDTAHYFLTWNSSLSNLRMNNVTNINFSTGTAANYVLQEKVYQNPATFLQGKIDGFGKSESFYLEGKGWFDQVYTYQDERSRYVQSPHPYTGSGAPKVSTNITIASASNASQNPDHRLIISHGQDKVQLVDTTFDGYHLLKYQFDLDGDQLGQDSTEFIFKSGTLTNAPASDRMAIGYFAITYPRTLDFDGSDYEEFLIPQSSSKTHLTLTDFSNATITHVYDPSTNNRIAVVQSGTNVQLLVPAGAERKLIVATADAVKTVSITALSGISDSGLFTDFRDLDPDSAFLIITPPALMTPAQDYADYRSAGGQTGIVVDVEQLYQQYAFGIWKHPLAIRNFADDMLANWTNDEHLMLLLGKSISNHKCRQNEENWALNLVPSFGWPSADNALTAGLHGSVSEPAIPTGRVAAHNTQEVEVYLEKVQAFEGNHDNSCIQQTEADKFWMKNVLHFGGGANSFEQGTFRNYLGNYADTITDEQFGGQVYSFYKSSADPIQSNLSDSINLLINQGVSLITFFGHASGGTFDISVDHPSAYENFEKYPLILANSCFSGDIHGESSISQSEQFVLIEDKGSIGFLASTHLGFSNHLNTYSKHFYTQLSKNYYGQSLGKQMYETVKAVQTTNPHALINTTAIEMTLHGDPAVVLNAHDKPDYLITEQNVFFNPDDVTTDLTDFSVNVIVKNLGAGTRDVAFLSVKRISPDGSEQTINQALNAVYHSDTIVVTFDIDLQSHVGLNQFEITIDPDQLVSELCEFNNSVTVDLWITSSDLIPTFPYDYAVVPDQDIVLRASTSDALANSRTYLMEIDTTDTYDSPKYMNTTVTSQGGTVSWDPGSDYFNMPDSTVYFWRASPDAQFVNDLRWRENSFQVVAGKTGWGQDHFFQFKEDDFTFIEHNRTTRTFDFVETVTALRATVYGNPSFGNDLFEFYNTQYSLNGAQQEFGICGATETMILVVIDSLTHEPWGTRQEVGGVVQNPDHGFGNSNDMGSGSSANCRGVVEKYFLFAVGDSTAMDGMANMLNNEIPDGAYIMAYTGMRGRFQESEIWQDHHFQAFEALGADSIRDVPNSNPYIFFCQKGKTSSAIELVGEHTKDVLTLEVSLFNNLSSGQITSTLVGPASDWGSLHWAETALEGGVLDDVELQVHGISNGVETLLMELNQDSLDVPDLDQYIDANQFPYLKLTAIIEDDSLFTSSQLDRWHVLYQERPEVAINPLLGSYFYTDTLEEGTDMYLALAIENISRLVLDSFYVHYWILDEDRKTTEVLTYLVDSLPPGEIRIDTIQFSSVGLVGDNQIWMEVNPQDSLWQPEQYHFNNVAKVDFHVLGDMTNPILDVTFDGVHILDGDIVAPEPEIKIWLQDENLYLPVDDTTAFKIFLTGPDGVEQRIWFTDATGMTILEFVPAELPDNEAVIFYEPKDLTDGIYQLRVQAADRSANASGLDYTINFEVITSSSLTGLLNYPNPFTTSTSFVFTLTGSELPDDFRIQIMTISGKVIREINLLDDPTLHIGRNVTDIKWDGTDRFGDAVGNGVYLYRVIAKLNGEDIDLRGSGADAYLNKGFGKMYLMR